MQIKLFKAPSFPNRPTLNGPLVVGGPPLAGSLAKHSLAQNFKSNDVFMQQQKEAYQIRRENTLKKRLKRCSGSQRSPSKYIVLPTVYYTHCSTTQTVVHTLGKNKRKLVILNWVINCDSQISNKI